MPEKNHKNQLVLYVKLLHKIMKKIKYIYSIKNSSLKICHRISKWTYSKLCSNFTLSSNLILSALVRNKKSLHSGRHFSHFISSSLKEKLKNEEGGGALKNRAKNILEL